MKRHVLIVARADVAASIRTAITTLIGKPVSWLAATPLRRSGDTPGTTSHYAAHGRVSDTLWSELVTILQDETNGVRDDVQWQGSPSPIADANWAVATDAGDLVAAYRLGEDESTFHEDVLASIAAVGLVFTAKDADDGIA